MSALRDSSSMCGRICSPPRAQLRPMVSGLAWRTVFQKASTVWPVSVRPEASVMVPEMSRGTREPRASKASSIATSAALRTSASKTVSQSRQSAPASSRASTCSR